MTPKAGEVWFCENGQLVYLLQFVPVDSPVCLVRVTGEHVPDSWVLQTIQACRLKERMAVCSLAAFIQD